MCEDMLPPTMKAGGQVYTPYSCLAFDIRPDGTAATDIEHIVALGEAHDSGIAADRRAGTSRPTWNYVTVRQARVRVCRSTRPNGTRWRRAD